MQPFVAFAGSWLPLLALGCLCWPLVALATSWLPLLALGCPCYLFVALAHPHLPWLALICLAGPWLPLLPLGCPCQPFATFAGPWLRLMALCCPCWPLAALADSWLPLLALCYPWRSLAPALIGHWLPSVRMDATWFATPTWCHAPGGWNQPRTLPHGSSLDTLSCIHGRPKSQKVLVQCVAAARCHVVAARCCSLPAGCVDACSDPPVLCLLAPACVCSYSLMSARLALLPKSAHIPAMRIVSLNSWGNTTLSQKPWFKRLCKSFSLSCLPPLPQSRRRYRSTLPYKPKGLLGQI